jgi:hypothetical protein
MSGKHVCNQALDMRMSAAEQAIVRAQGGMSGKRGPCWGCDGLPLYHADSFSHIWTDYPHNLEVHQNAQKNLKQFLLNCKSVSSNLQIRQVFCQIFVQCFLPYPLSLCLALPSIVPSELPLMVPSVYPVFGFYMFSVSVVPFVMPLVVPFSLPLSISLAFPSSDPSSLPSGGVGYDGSVGCALACTIISSISVIFYGSIKSSIAHAIVCAMKVMSCPYCLIHRVNSRSKNPKESRSAASCCTDSNLDKCTDGLRGHFFDIFHVYEMQDLNNGEAKNFKQNSLLVYVYDEKERVT